MSETTSTFKKVRLGGLPVVVATRKAFAQRLLEDWRLQQAAGRSLPTKLSFSANGQILAECNGDPALRELYASADYIHADGMSLVKASRYVAKEPLPERIATTDFFHDAAEVARENGLSFYILGSTPENNAAVCARLAQLYPGLRIAGAQNGYFSATEEPAVIQAIQEAKPDVLWVGMGFPKQALFSLRNREAFRGIAWVKTCGGLYEHILELHPRAPVWVQKAGFEWLHRALCEPRRLLWRYIKTNPLAIYYMLTRSER